MEGNTSVSFVGIVGAVWVRMVGASLNIHDSKVNMRLDDAFLRELVCKVQLQRVDNHPSHFLPCSKDTRVVVS